MKHEVDVRNGIRPAGIVREVRCDEAERVAVHHSGIGEQRPHVRLASQRPDRRPHEIAPLE